MVAVMVIGGDIEVDGAIITGGAVVADTTMVGGIIAIGGDRPLITYQEAASVSLRPLSSRLPTRPKQCRTPHPIEKINGPFCSREGGPPEE
jgi:hypothetical protein